MMNIRNTAAKAFTIFTQIIDARRALASVSHRPWLDACSLKKRVALERSRFSILPQSLKISPSFVIDVGANQGQWISSLMELLCVPEVWIFEPNPEAMLVCKERVGSRPGVKYFDMALGETTGRITLHVTASSDFASVLKPRNKFLATHYGENAAQILDNKQVEMNTLDNLVPKSKFVDLLKIDVQGFERAVLSGALRVLKETRVVLIEANLESHYVGDDTFPALWTLLSNQGFSFYRLSSPYLGKGGKALWADAVFVREDSI